MIGPVIDLYVAGTWSWCLSRREESTKEASFPATSSLLLYRGFLMKGDGV